MSAAKYAPTSKVAATGVAGAAVLVAQYVLGLFGIELPEDVALAVLFLAMWAAGYLKAERTPGRREKVN